MSEDPIYNINIVQHLENYIPIHSMTSAMMGEKAASSEATQMIDALNA